VSYALLRAAHGLTHDEALARVGERVERGDRSTDPAVGTGDYGDFSGKTVRALVARLPLGLWV